MSRKVEVPAESDCMKHYLEFDEMGLMGKGIRQRLIVGRSY